MLIADLEGARVKADPGMVGATCPECSNRVMAKCGEYVTWHFAHFVSQEDCYWYGGGEETEWHRSWKSHAPIDRCERVGERDGKKARADVISDNVAIEFQSASLESGIRDRREYVWNNVLWVIDARHILDDSRNRLNRSSGRTSATLIWKHASKWWRDCKRAVVFDIGEGELLSVIEVRDEGYFRIVGQIIPADDLIDGIKNNKLRTLLRQSFKLTEDDPQKTYNPSRRSKPLAIDHPSRCPKCDAIESEDRTKHNLGVIIGSTVTCFSCGYKFTRPIGMHHFGDVNPCDGCRKGKCKRKPSAKWYEYVKQARVPDPVKKPRQTKPEGTPLLDG